MSLDMILLGMLRTPASGYDLRDEFARGPSNYWPARLSQIYPTLKRLARDGFLDAVREPSELGPPRTVYSLTPAGRDRFLDWLRGEPALGTERFGYLAQLACMAELNDLSQTERFMRDLREKLSAWLERLEEIAAQIERDVGSWQELDEATFHEVAALRMGLHTLRAKVAWCDETIARVRARREDAPTPMSHATGAAGSTTANGAGTAGR